MGFSFPARCISRCLPDDAFAGAYEALAPEERAWMKTAIARVISALSSCSCPEAGVVASCKTMRQGFSLHEQTRPADWAVIFWDGSYSGWVRILAAILPAILAGVPNCLACRVGAASSDGPVPDAVLAAMELAGQELIADLSLEDAVSLLDESARQGHPGRVVLLGGDEGLDVLAATASRLGLSVRRESQPVRIAVATGLPSSVLQFAHPDVAFLPYDALCAPFSMLFCEREIVDDHIARVPLVLTPGQEAFWVWQDIDVAFFQEKSLAVTAPYS